MTGVGFQDLDEIDLGMQDSALEVVCKQQIAAAADMKNRRSQFLEFYIHKIGHRIIFHETAGLHLHSEGIHLGQILIVFGLNHYPILLECRQLGRFSPRKSPRCTSDC